MPEKPKGTWGDALRTSKLRAAAGDTLVDISMLLHEKFPGLTPDMISYTGPLLVLTGGILAYFEQEKALRGELVNRVPSLSFLIAGNLVDGLDGTYARTLRELGVKLDPMHGQLVDVFCDRLEETILTQTKAHMARKRCDEIGYYAALFNQVTSPLPSLARSFAEAHKISVPEDGHNWLHFVGSRPGRAVGNIISTVWPDTQPALDVFMGVANIANTFDRVAALYGAASAGEVPPEKINEARVRFSLLLGCTVASSVAAAYTNLYNE